MPERKQCERHLAACAKANRDLRTRRRVEGRCFACGAAADSARCDTCKLKRAASEQATRLNERLSHVQAVAELRAIAPIQEGSRENAI